MCIHLTTGHKACNCRGFSLSQFMGMYNLPYIGRELEDGKLFFNNRNKMAHLDICVLSDKNCTFAPQLSNLYPIKDIVVPRWNK